VSSQPNDPVAMPTTTEISGGPPGLAAFASLVHLAVTSDNPARLIEAAEGELGQPLGLVGPRGEALGHAPNDGAGERALAIARAAARTGVAAPPGWRVLALSQSSPPAGFLATETNGGSDGETHPRLALVAELAAEQLKRSALRAAQVDALVRRLTADPHLTVDQARREAADLDLPLAGTYWPGLLTWRSVPPLASIAVTVAATACRLVSGSMATMLGDQIVLLHPGNDTAPEEPAPAAWFEEVAHQARSLAPGSRAQIVAVERPVELGRLRMGVAELRDVLPFSHNGADERGAVSVRQFGLERLLWSSLEAIDGPAFVEERLGRLMEWDRRHRAGLLVVLEAALDFPRRDEAAGRCFMHRNTFRHRLREAEALLEDDLGEPDARLAIHIALKLRRLLNRRDAGERTTDGHAGPGATHRAPSLGRRRVRTP
jgi:PucR C-terminal helix-turn-helix domain